MSDQTLALARALHAFGASPVIVARAGDAAPFAPITCVTGVAPLDAPRVAARHGATRILYQYVPFLYARHGVAPSLLRLPARCRETGIALELFVHEPYVPFTRPAWFLTGLPQRLQLRALARAARRTYTAVPAFAARIQRWAGSRAAVTVAPVGASVPVAEVACRDAVRARLALASDEVAIGVFSAGASGFRADWIEQAALRIPAPLRARWVLFGGGSARALPRLAAQRRTIVIGRSDARVVAEVMRAVDLAAQPYVDGLTLRRTGAMLALATGIPTVSSTGPLFDAVAGAMALCQPDAPAFADCLVHLVRDRAARAAAAARTAGYAATASVERLAQVLIGTGAP